MELDHDARMVAHEHPCNQDAEGLIRALRHDGFGLEAADFASDADGQLKIEARPCQKPPRWDQLEPVTRGRTAI